MVGVVVEEECVLMAPHLRAHLDVIRRRVITKEQNNEISRIDKAIGLGRLSS